MKILFFLALLPAYCLASYYDIEQIEKRVGNNCLLTLDVEQVQIDDSGIPAVQFRAQNASPNKYYTLISRNLNKGLMLVTKKGIVDQNGIVTFKKKGEQKPCSIQSRGVLRGEPFDYYLISEDRSEIAKKKGVPFPIAAACHGYQLDIEMSEGSGQIFHYSASGFEPNEEIGVSSFSLGEEIRQKVKVGNNGEMEGFTAPAVIGFPGGTAKIELTGKKGVISVDYAWGNEHKVVFPIGS